jgi:acyl transferase domain-containing protein/NADPH:quinone reductase-like Zn-dependent oxidoreductase/NAD(P)-dependent dehydrogenase (short-subunit alcohol dehydrogenase family)/dienelactone hydrolase
MEPLAIVGIGCRFPGGVSGPDDFWDLLLSGVDTIGEVPPERWRTERFYDPDPDTPGRVFVRHGGFLTEPVDRFDAGFFGITPREAATLDPQQRLLLEVTWKALEDACIPPSTLAGRAVGTYIGNAMVDSTHLQISEANIELVGTHTATGASLTLLSARLAHTFDWRGPCLSIDTACSSSLVAFHYACGVVASGECDAAIAGGVNVMLDPAATIVLAKGHFLSPDGRCKAFDHRANGYARGEGAGVVIIKRLADARRDGDRVYATVLGTAVNQDGHTPGITVPSAVAQRAAISAACDAAGIEPSSITYFEAHGTGTPVGDPIEAGAIGDSIAGSVGRHWIGSVKTNIGHLEGASGVAGLIKAALCVDRGLIPPNLHFERPNPAIAFDSLPLRVPTKVVEFDSGAGPRRAGVNSFGFGGTNAHAVVEQAPPLEQAEPEGGGPLLLPISARSAAALRALVDAYATMLTSQNAPALNQACRAASRGRAHHPLRAFVMADDAADAATALRALEIDDQAVRTGGSGAVFVYTGMGPQWWGMGHALMHEEPVFAETVLVCDQVLARFGVSMAEEFQRDQESSRLAEPLYAQVGNFVVQAGLTAVWQSWGCEPSAVIGHSVGEVSASYAAGVYPLEDALTISYHRACQTRLAGPGAMLAVGLAADDVAPYLVDGVCVAARNSPSASTLSGDREALGQVADRLRGAAVFVRELRVDIAYHSHCMDAIREPLLASLAGLRPRESRLPLMSAVTGDWLDGTDMDAGYWWRNVRQPVRFAEAVERVVATGPAAFLEVGPHPVLAPAIREAVANAGADIAVLTSQHRDRPGARTLREALGGFYVAGGQLDWARIHPGPRRHVDLPKYPWQRERHWRESPYARSARLGDAGWLLAGRRLPAPMPTWDTELSPAEFPYLADHRIGGTVVFPGAGYVEAALAAFGQDVPCVLEDVVLDRTLALPPKSITTLRVSHDPLTREVTMHARRSGDDSGWSRHATLRRVTLADPAPPPAVAAEPPAGWPEMAHEQVYAQLADAGLPYGPAFRGIDRLWWRQGEVFARIDVDRVDQSGYRLHPALLDAALHAMLVGSQPAGATRTYVPVRIDEVRFYRSPGRSLWVRGRGTAGQDRVEGDLTLITDDGAVVAELIGMRAQALTDSAEQPGQAGEELYYEQVWRPEPIEDDATADGTWTVVGASPLAAGIAAGLAARGGQVQRVVPEGDWLTGFTAGSRGVIYVVDTDYAGDTACGLCVRPLELIQALREPTSLVLVTSGAQGLDDEGPLDPFAASVWGLGRVVNAEHPELRCRQIDADEASQALIDELTHAGADDVLLRAGRRRVLRFQHASASSPLHHLIVDTASTPVRLCTGNSIEDLRVETSTRREPGPTEVELSVAYTGLNFKDLLKATGLLAREAMERTHSGTAVGIECSGTVVRVGAEVTGLRAGDEVFAVSRDLFSSYVTLDQVHVVRRPATLSLAQAASLFPVITAYVALVRLANVQPGERVLVHSGTGGVGLAAIRIAKWLGAEVFATAGSQQRREILRAEGVAGVADSRTTAFVDEIRAWTGGEGVDAVVNSIPGEILEKSLGLLRPLGRFVELGKADFAADRTLRLRPFNRSISFHAFDYDRLLLLRPDLSQRYMQEVARLYDEGAIAPLPVTDVPIGEAATAFRMMARREHVGKIVVGVADQWVSVPASSMPAAPLAPGTYVVTGGLSGFGLAAGRWLADRGARHLLLLSRRGIASPEAERVVAELREQGVTVRVAQADVTDRAQLGRTLDDARRELPPLRGVVHAAVVYDNVLLADMSIEHFLGATSAKADGAWNLHLETEQDQLDLFVLFSSTAAQFGGSKVGPYAAANEFLNALAGYRRAHGRPAIAVGWGAVADVGVAARYDQVGNSLSRRGFVGTSAQRLLAELTTLLRTNPVRASVGGMDWDRWARANLHLATLPRYAEVAPTGAVARSDASLPDRLRAATRDQRLGLLPALVEDLLCLLTGLSKEQVSGQVAVTLDSMMSVELKVLLRDRLGVAVPIVELLQNLTAARLVEVIADAFDDTGEDAMVPVVHELTSSDGLTVYGHLSMPPGPGPHPAVVVCSPDPGGVLDADGQYLRIPEHPPLVAAGFAVFSVDRRGALGHGDAYAARIDVGGREVDDILAAAHYLVQLAGIDADRLSIFGTSRGAYAALLALTRAPELWHRGVLAMGFYDPARYMAYERAARPDTSRLIANATWDELAALMSSEDRMPLSALGGVSAPLYILHGESDEVTPVDHAHDLAERAEAIGIPARLVVVRDMGHDIDHANDAWTHLWPDLVSFLNDGAISGRTGPVPLQN